MKILIVGSGGREHALAWKIADSRLLTGLYAAPGNAGTAAYCENLPIQANDIEGLVEAAFAHMIDLVIAGPEIPLALGLVDALESRSLKEGRRIFCFGPTAAAARIESSKSFSKQFMTRHGIPTARHEVCDDFETAVSILRAWQGSFVIKASGLASGKGVFLPDTVGEGIDVLRSLLVDGSLGKAGQEVVIEERLEGEEISLMAFSDGTIVRAMPLAQDHKRLLDGDQGPNTGGMGSYAPLPHIPESLSRLCMEKAIMPVIRGLADEGNPFRGVLYAGLMITPSGPRVLEYNCRFGDPETQAILPLYDGDLLPVLLACAQGSLEAVPTTWREGFAACVVVASPGYPENPKGGTIIQGLDISSPKTFVFHAGTEKSGTCIIARPGRVLGVTGRGDTLRDAVDAAYARLGNIRLDGARYRRDIAWRGLKAIVESGKADGAADTSRFPARVLRDEPVRKWSSVRFEAAAKPDPESGGSAYANSGVDIDAGNKAVQLMSGAVKSTYTPAVLAGIGSFGGLFDAGVIKGMNNPVLVASTDGVGTKVKLAAAAGSYASAGADIVNHCIDDILVQGARPLFFLDYVASAKLDPDMVAQIVTGMSDACRISGCALLGGETAEMPGVYRDGEFDVAGTIVGIVERDRILPRPDISEGDLLVGFRSNSPHTNGYSLIRKAFESIPLDTVYPELGPPDGKSLKDVLLVPHRSYLPLIGELLEWKPGLIKGLAHITGGGFIENIPRILPEGLTAVVERGTWPEPAIYGIIRRLAAVDRDEMYRVFNMGIGMVAVVESRRAGELMASIPEPCWIIGRIERSQSGDSGSQARLEG